MNSVINNSFGLAKSKENSPNNKSFVKRYKNNINDKEFMKEIQKLFSKYQ